MLISLHVFLLLISLCRIKNKLSCVVVFVLWKRNECKSFSLSPAWLAMLLLQRNSVRSMNVLSDGKMQMGTTAVSTMPTFIPALWPSWLVWWCSIMCSARPYLYSSLYIHKLWFTKTTVAMSVSFRVSFALVAEAARQDSESHISGTSLIHVSLHDLDHCAANRERKTDHCILKQVGQIVS